MRLAIFHNAQMVLNCAILALYYYVPYLLYIIIIIIKVTNSMHAYRGCSANRKDLLVTVQTKHKHRRESDYQALYNQS